MVPRFASAHRQRGAIGLMAAITLGMALLFMLLVIDSGRLYMEKRMLQRVVDTAALEASNLNAVCSGTGVNALTQATASAMRNGYTVGTGNTLTATCGTLTTGSNNLRAFTASATATQAIQVTAAQTVTSSFANGLWTLLGGGGFSTSTTLHATATAGYVGGPLAQLNIRSSLATVDSSQSPLLNALLGGLLGGSLNLSAAQYDGLLKTDVNLLSFLNQAAISANITAGDYTTLLNTNLSVTTLVQAAATLVQQNGAAATVTTALGQISAIGSGSTIKLGDLLDTTTGTSTAGLNGTLQLLTLLQSIIELAGSGSAVSLGTAISVPGIAGLTTQISIIEPPQFSAIGDPRNATDDTSAGRIYVRTAQVRILLTLQLTAVTALTSTVNGLTSTLLGVLKPIVCLLGCTLPDVKLLPDGATLSVGIDAGGASSWVTGYTCTGTQKTLTVQAKTSAASLMVGNIDSSAFFSSSTATAAAAFNVLDVGTTQCGALGLGCGARTPYGGGGLGLSINSAVAQPSTPFAYTYVNPPNLGLASQNYTFTSSNVVNSLSGTLKGISLVSYPATTPNLLSALTGLVSGLINSVVGLVLTPIISLLSSLVDPLLNSLLSLLGVDLANATVGANLSCQTGRAQLVL